MADRSVALIALAMVSVLATAQAQSLSPQEVFQRVSPSVVLIEVYDKQGEFLSQGSGVVVDDGVVATNCHVLTAKGSHYATIQWRNSRTEIDGNHMLQGDVERDLCTVKVPDLHAPAVTMIDSSRVNIGSKVYAVGAPEGLELTLSEGLISGKREVEGLRLLQTTAPISQGSSGGGLFDAQGRLVGITAMYMKDGQSLNFAVPAELIASIPEMQPGTRRSERQTDPKPPSLSKASTAETRWMYVTENIDGGVVVIDKRTMSRSGSDVTAWSKTEYGSPQVDKFGDTYDELSQSVTYHCATRQISSLVVVQRLRGKVIYSNERKSYEVERKRIEPGTIAEALFETVCNL